MGPSELRSELCPDVSLPAKLVLLQGEYEVER
jgi:hypothetical protein